jgi:hypothetical protein
MPGSPGYSKIGDMTIGTSLLLTAAGAILRYAITAQLSWIDLRAAGVVLMLVGAAGLTIGLVLIAREGSTASPPEDFS